MGLVWLACPLGWQRVPSGTRKARGASEARFGPNPCGGEAGRGFCRASLTILQRNPMKRTFPKTVAATAVLAMTGGFAKLATA